MTRLIIDQSSNQTIGWITTFLRWARPANLSLYVKSLRAPTSFFLFQPIQAGPLTLRQRRNLRMFQVRHKTNHTSSLKSLNTPEKDEKDFLGQSTLPWNRIWSVNQPFPHTWILRAWTMKKMWDFFDISAPCQKKYADMQYMLKTMPDFSWQNEGFPFRH